MLYMKRDIEGERSKEKICYYIVSVVNDKILESHVT